MLLASLYGIRRAVRLPTEIPLDNRLCGRFTLFRLTSTPSAQSLSGFPPISWSGQCAEQLSTQTGFNPKGATVPEETPQTGLSDNAAGALAYFTFIPAIIFLLVAPYNQKASIRFHAWQSILLTAAAIVIDIALGIVLGIATLLIGVYAAALLWKLIELCWFAIWLVCVINAFQGKQFKLPILGDYCEKLANK
jgi:uncharacterized membrane protein